MFRIRETILVRNGSGADPGRPAATTEGPDAKRQEVSRPGSVTPRKLDDLRPPGDAPFGFRFRT